MSSWSLAPKSLAVLTLGILCMETLHLQAAPANSTFSAPNTEQLSQWGLEYIPPYSTPHTLNWKKTEEKGYLLLGPKSGDQRLCVSLVRFVDAHKACGLLKCRVIINWEEDNPPMDQQHALLTQPCSQATEWPTTLIYHSHVRSYSLDMAFNSHIHALSASAYDETLDSKDAKAGPWAQGQDRKQWTIDFSTVASDGNLSWHPLKGFDWKESEP